jgi:fatty acid desaturase
VAGTERRKLHKWFFPLASLYGILGFLVAFLPLLGVWSLGVVVALSPLSLYYYGYIHDWVHRSSNLKRLDERAVVAVLACAPFGMSWVIYARHHWNHHQFNNAVGDYSKTTRADGSAVPGWLYLWKTAVYPSFLQWVPFLSVVAMRPQHRTALAWFDEAARVSVRVMVAIFFGWQGLGILLFCQVCFLANLFYINYLQHFDCGPQEAVVWAGPFFNRWTHNLGLHQHHHQEPQTVSEALQAYPSKRVYRAAWADPVAFVFFLFSPSLLRVWLARKEAVCPLPH